MDLYHCYMPHHWPELAVLELFVAVAEHGSLSAAARAVDMAQPNATRAIARLERSFGIQLIDRHPRGSRLTADGAVVMDWARTVLDSAEQLRVATEALHSKRHSQLTVAASMTVAESFMPVWLAELRRTHPDLAIKLRVHNSEEVFDLIADRACDIGFVESPSVRTGLRSTAVAHDRLVVVVAPDHPWSRRRRPVTPVELARTPLVVREPGSGTRTTLETALGAVTPVAPLLELNSNTAVRVSVAAGVGPAVLSELAVAALLKTGELVAVPTDGLPLDRTMRAVWGRPTDTDGAAGDLVRIARNSL
jgi:DNA-binding transcriptional LysR family regulator